MTPEALFTASLDEQTIADPAVLLPDRLARAATTALDVPGAGLSYTLLPDRRLPLGASNTMAATAERLQFALGEGPCLSAQRERGTIVADQPMLEARWPVYTHQLTAQTDYRSVIAVPVGGPLSGVAAIDIYSQSARPHPSTLEHTQLIADLIGAALATAITGDPDRFLGAPSSLTTPPVTDRRRVWLAVGHLAAQTNYINTAALARLRALAFGLGLDLETTADRILSGELEPT